MAPLPRTPRTSIPATRVTKGMAALEQPPEPPWRAVLGCVQHDPADPFGAQQVDDLLDVFHECDAVPHDEQQVIGELRRKRAVCDVEARWKVEDDVAESRVELGKHVAFAQL